MLPLHHRPMPASLTAPHLAAMFIGHRAVCPAACNLVSRCVQCNVTSQHGKPHSRSNLRTQVKCCVWQMPDTASGASPAFFRTLVLSLALVRRAARGSALFSLPFPRSVFL